MMRIGMALLTRRLNDDEISALMPYVPLVDLAAAILHIGRVPWYLPCRFAAIVRGNDIYIRSGIYDPLTPAGVGAVLGPRLLRR